MIYPASSRVSCARDVEGIALRYIYSESGQTRHFGGRGSFVSADAAVGTKAAARTLSRSAVLRP